MPPIRAELLDELLKDYQNGYASGRRLTDHSTQHSVASFSRFLLRRKLCSARSAQVR